MPLYLLSFVVGSMLFLASQSANKWLGTACWGLGLIGLWLFVGTAEEMSCDAVIYQRYFNQASNGSLLQLLAGRDPGFFLLNWIGGQLPDATIGRMFVQMTMAGIFAAGLAMFCRPMPNRGLALILALPFLVLVVGIGYVRQATAFGLMLIFFSLPQRNMWQKGVKTGLLTLATSFHLPFGLIACFLFLSLGFPRRALIVASVLALALAIVIVDLEHLIHTINYYMSNALGPQSAVQSLGAYYRVPLAALAGVAIILGWIQVLGRPHLELFRGLAVLGPIAQNYKGMIPMALFAICLVVVMIPLSTVADRYAIYANVLILAVAGHARQLANPWSTLIQWGAIPASAGLLVLWLVAASHRNCWLPYDSYLT